jgi:hypothetical protein
MNSFTTIGMILAGTAVAVVLLIDLQKGRERRQAALRMAQRMKWRFLWSGDPIASITNNPSSFDATYWSGPVSNIVHGQQDGAIWHIFDVEYRLSKLTFIDQVIAARINADFPYIQISRRAATQVERPGRKRTTVAVRPDFDEVYIVTTEEPGRVHEVLGPAVIEHLMGEAILHYPIYWELRGPVVLICGSTRQPELHPGQWPTLVSFVQGLFAAIAADRRQDRQLGSLDFS